MPALSGAELAAAGPAERTADVRARVARARAAQSARAAALGLADAVNATMPVAAARACCVLGPESRALLRQAVDRLGLSPRAYHRLGRVARTIADLGGDASIGAPHVAEAIGYRTLDRAMQSGAVAPF